MKQLAIATSLVCTGFVVGCGNATEPTSKRTQPPTVAPVAAEEKPAASQPANTAATDAELRARRFTLHYRFKVKDLKPVDDAEQNLVRVWLPSASASDEQDVRRLAATAPGEVSESTDAQFGNRILFFETTIPETGQFSVDVPYEVTRREVLRGSLRATTPVTEKLDDSKREFFLRADAMVPTTGKPLKLLDMVDLLQDKFARARQLYDIVDNHVAYKKEGTGWGRGD
ncbi:MAG: hypothetical protein IAG10_17840, partial [Planctomycetaceae bacterium]|nr:hypothetical protein [Planctomycetaceae bacterium]